MHASLTTVRWGRLAAGTVLTAICALSVHAAAVELLHVSPPAGYPAGGAWAFLTEVAMALASILLWRLAAGRVAALPFPVRCLLLFLLLAMLSQKLIRWPLMNGVTTTAWVFSFLSDIPSLVPLLVLACLVVAAPPLARPWQKIAAAIGFAALAFPVCGTLFARTFRPVLASASFLDHDVVYAMPYGPHVLLPAYATALEPAAATVALAALVWDALPGEAGSRLARFALLVMAANLHLLQPLALLFAGSAHLGAALAGAGQSWLATLVQTLLGGATWALSRGRRADPPQAPLTLRPPHAHPSQD